MTCHDTRINMSQNYRRINDEIDEINCCGVNVCCNNSNSSIYSQVSFVTEDDELTNTVIAGKF